LENTNKETAFSITHCFARRTAASDLILDENTFASSICAYQEQTFTVNTETTYTYNEFVDTFNTLRLDYGSVPNSRFVVTNEGLKCLSPGVSSCGVVGRGFYLPVGQTSQGFYFRIQGDCTPGQSLKLNARDLTLAVTQYTVDCNDITSNRFVGFVLSEGVSGVLLVSTFNEYHISAVGVGQTTCPPSRAPTGGASKGSKAGKRRRPMMNTKMNKPKEKE
jgi:hypothetical protein